MSNVNTNTRIPVNMQGTAFVNAKRPDRQDPDYTGTARINNQDVLVSVWINVSKAGKPYLSLRFRTPQPVQASLDLENLQQPEDIEQRPAA